VSPFPALASRRARTFRAVQNGILVVSQAIAARITPISVQTMEAGSMGTDGTNACAAPRAIDQSAWRNSVNGRSMAGESSSTCWKRSSSASLSVNSATACSRPSPPSQGRISPAASLSMVRRASSMWPPRRCR